MALSKSQQTHALISLFVSQHERCHGRKPDNFNRYRLQAGFSSMIEDLGYAQARTVIEYYFQTPKREHTAVYLVYNYDRLATAMVESEKDALERERLRIESKERVEQWKREHEF